MKKCYIAGKIGGLLVYEYFKNFDDACGEVAMLGYKPISPTQLPHNHDRSWSSYMKEDLIAMIGCDAVYVLRNWRTSPGATIEVNLALQLSIDIIYQK